MGAIAKPTFGERLRDLRVERHMTQDDIAKIFGIDRSTVSQWEDDQNRPRFDTLIELSRLYNVTLDYLMCQENEDANFLLNEVLVVMERRAYTVSEIASMIKELSDVSKETVMKVLLVLQEGTPVDLNDILKGLQT